MRRIKETEAKEQFAELLQEVERGESIAIVRDGNTIARLDPPRSDDWALDDSEEARERRREGVKAFREWQRTREPINITVEEFMEWRREGHKY